MSDGPGPAAPAAPVATARDAAQINNDPNLTSDYHHNARTGQLLRRNRRGGTLNETKLDYDQSRKIDILIHTLEDRGYSFGEFMDWLAEQAVRPTIGGGVASVTNYALKSFFINVSDPRDKSPGLFNMLLAEAIQVLFEFVVSCVAKPIMNEEPEVLTRKGFDSIAQKCPRGLNKALFDAVDDQLDALETAVEGGIEKGSGIYKGLTSGAGHAYYITARFIAQKALKLPDGKPGDSKVYDENIEKWKKRWEEERIEIPWTKQMLIESPAAVLDFYNYQLAKKGAGIQIESDHIDKEKKSNAEKTVLIKEREALLKENETLKTTLAGKENEDLKDTRNTANTRTPKPLAV